MHNKGVRIWEEVVEQIQLIKFRKIQRLGVDTILE